MDGETGWLSGVHVVRCCQGAGGGVDGETGVHVVQCCQGAGGDVDGETGG